METKSWSGEERKDLSYDELELLVARGRSLRAQMIADTFCRMMSAVQSILKLTFSNQDIKNQSTYGAEIYEQKFLQK